MGRRLRELPVDVGDLLVRGHGIVCVADAKEAGICESRLRRLTAAGLLTHLAEGSYADPRMMADLDEWQRFGYMARAFALSCGPDVYLTGWAATVVQQLPTIGRPPRRPTLVRPKALRGGSWSGRRGRIVVATVPVEHRKRAGRLGVMSAAWSVVDLARTARLPDAMVVADETVRRGTDLRSILPHMRRWPGVARARWVIEQANPAAESPLETLGRFTCLEFGLPMFVANAWVGRDGPERRVDGLFPWHGAVVEGDGGLKYDNRNDASQIVRAQNEREFYLRRLGLDFLRYSWCDVYPTRAPLARKIKALLGDNPRRPEPVRWWKNVPETGPAAPEPDDYPPPYPPGIILPAGWSHDLDGRNAR